MSLLSTGAVLLVLAAGGEPQAPRPIDFIWSQGPYPAADSSYVSCGKPEAAGADYCVPDGTWTGLCSTESLRTTMKRFDGPLVFQQGVPRIEGCEKNVMLLWKRQGDATPAYQHPTAGPQDMGEDRERVTLTLPGRTYDLVLKKKELRLEVKVDVGGKVSQREVDLREVFGEAVKEARFVTLDFAGDISGDGEPEAIIGLDVGGYTKDYARKWSIPLAALVTLSEPPRVLGFTSGSPQKLYGSKSCKALGCDVISFLDKKESCEHFAGEESSNEERRREIKKALQGCEKLEQQRKALLQKYRRDERVQKALTAEP
jgi:hypothetical protein